VSPKPPEGCPLDTIVAGSGTNYRLENGTLDDFFSKELS
jgi:hypothetical protein